MKRSIVFLSMALLGTCVSQLWGQNPGVSFDAATLDQPNYVAGTPTYPAAPPAYPLQRGNPQYPAAQQQPYTAAPQYQQPPYAVAQQPQPVWGQPAPAYGNPAGANYADTGHSATYSAAPPAAQPVTNPAPAEPTPAAEPIPAVEPEPQPRASNRYLDILNSPWGDKGFNGQTDTACDDCDPCNECGMSPCRCSPWFATGGGLYMNRTDENKAWFSYYDNDESNQLNCSRETEMEWSGGFEVRFGRTFCCDCYGVEAVYWGIFPDERESNLYASVDPLISLNSVPDFSRLNYSNTTVPETSVDYRFNDSHQRVRRDYEIHNVEVNLLGGRWRYAPSNRCAGLDLGWVAGVRYFRFAEGLQFATSHVSPTFGVNPDEEMFYNIDLKNDLVGFQLGGSGDYRTACGIGLHCRTSVGVFGNHITHVSQVVGADGSAAWVGAGPNAGMLFDIHSDKDDVSLLAEIDLGVSYQFTPRWRATVGYRAVGVTGVALAVEQIPVYFAAIQDVEMVDSNGDMILHGGYLEVEYNW